MDESKLRRADAAIRRLLAAREALAKAHEEVEEAAEHAKLTTDAYGDMDPMAIPDGQGHYWLVECRGTALHIQTTADMLPAEEEA